MGDGGWRIVRREVDAGVLSGLAANLPPALARVYAARGVRTATDVTYSLDGLLSPDSLLGLESAVALLADALANDQSILVVADFDADGATSCAVMIRALRAFGARDVRYIVPNRFEYGYGLTPEIVTLAAALRPDLLVTVDNGISSVDGVAAAKAGGMRVLITDHHLPGPVLPQADAIVNPNQSGCRFASKHLAGVGVAFYVMLALRARLRESGWFARRGLAEPNLATLLDLVALGTVADVVPLDRNNRVLVAQGLARLNAGRAHAGVLALLQVAGRTPGRLIANDFGFCVAPRLNAAGRLEDMSIGIECLLTDDPERAGMLARELDRLNRERRVIEDEMQQQAQVLIDGLRLDAGLPRGLCLFDEAWHQGVIGIVAGRIKDRVHRPVIAFAPVSAHELKGSARSVPGVHVRDVLDAVAARHPGMLTKFGGHAMAAGLTLARAHLPAFERAFAEEVSRWLAEEDLYGRVLSDGELATGEFGVELAESLRAGGPWGQGFPEPVFDGEFDVLERRIVGEQHLKLMIRPPLARTPVEAIIFRQIPAITVGARIRAAYKPDVNEWQGRRALQLVLTHLATD